MRYKEDKRLESTKKSLLDDKEISKKNKDTILDYLDELQAKGISTGRVQKYCYYLTRIAKWLHKDFSKADKHDIVKILNKIETAKVRGGNRKGKPLSDWGKHDYRAAVKIFYKWLREQEGQTFGLREYPPEVSWFPISFPKKKRRKPRNLLTIKDVEKIVNEATNTRDKLFVRLLYESGARIGELLDLTLDGIEWDEHGVKIQIYGKTGERRLRITDSAPLLSAWLREHPKREDNKAKLFCGINSDNDPSYDYFRLKLRELGKNAKIKKPVNPHHWRHSRATELSKHLTEPQLCMYMGWVPGSSQPGTYVHLSGRDLDSAILEMKGIKVKQNTEENKDPITCPRCKTVNDYLSKFCINCGLGLDEKTMIEYDQQKETAANKGLNTLFQQVQSLQKQLQELQKQQ